MSTFCSNFAADMRLQGIWIIGIAILKRLDRIFIKPVQELNNVIFEYNQGNRMRRCPSVTYSKDLQKLYDGINKILDNK